MSAEYGVCTRKSDEKFPSPATFVLFLSIQNYRYPPYPLTFACARCRLDDNYKSFVISFAMFIIITYINMQAYATCSAVFLASLKRTLIV